MTLAGGVVDRAVMAARFPGYYTRYVGEGEIAAIQQTGLLRGGRPGETYFTIRKIPLCKGWPLSKRLIIVWSLRFLIDLLLLDLNV